MSHQDSLPRRPRGLPPWSRSRDVFKGLRPRSLCSLRRSGDAQDGEGGGLCRFERVLGSFLLVRIRIWCCRSVRPEIEYVLVITLE